MKKVLMIVLNSVTHDARVLKEAGSLVQNGYEVQIIGLSKYLESTEISGASVSYVSQTDHVFLSMCQLKKIRTLFLSHLFLIISFLCLLIFLFEVQFENYFFSIDYLSHFKKNSFLYLSIGFFLYFLYGIRARIFQKITAFHLTLLVFYRIFSMREGVLKKVKSMRPDIIHAHDLNALIIAKYCKDKHPSVLIYDSHEIFAETTNSPWIRKAIFKIYEAYLSKSVDYFITINESIASYLNAKYLKLPKAHIIMNACRLPASKVKNYNLIRQLIHVQLQTKIILYQGGISGSRGLQSLIRMVPFLDQNWVLVFMGDGNATDTLKKMALKLGILDEKVFFIPTVPHAELTKWTASATIGVIPYENHCLNHLYCTPNKLWEYPVATIPFFANNLVEIKKVLDKGVGWVIKDQNNPRLFAAQINALSEKEIKLAKNNCKKFVEESNWEKEEEKLLNLYLI